MKFTKLLDETGAPIQRPLAVSAIISLDAKEALAQAWAYDGRTLLAEMHCARVVWIGATGIRLEGMEPVEDVTGQRYRAMVWQQIF